MKLSPEKAEEYKGLSKAELQARGFSRREAVKLHKGEGIDREPPRCGFNGFGHYGKVKPRRTKSIQEFIEVDVKKFSK